MQHAAGGTYKILLAVEQKRTQDLIETKAIDMKEGKE